MLELKAVIKLKDVHLAQAINYLEAYGLSRAADKLWQYQLTIQKSNEAKKSQPIPKS